MTYRVSKWASSLILACAVAFGQTRAMSNPPEVSPQTLHVALNGDTMTIDAEHVPLSEILEEIHKQTGVDIQLLPNMTEPFVTHLTGSPRSVMSELLDGCGFNYVILGSAEDRNKLARLIFSDISVGSDAPKTGSAESTGTRPRREAVLRNASPGWSDGAGNTPIEEPSPSVFTPPLPAPSTPVGFSENGVSPGADKSADPLQVHVDAQTASDPISPGVTQASIAVSKTTDKVDAKIGAAGQMLQEMYKARQQLQPVDQNPQ